MLQNLAFTIENLKNAYKNGLSPQDVINEIFDRIKIINDPNIFINSGEHDNPLKAFSTLVSNFRNQTTGRSYEDNSFYQ